MSVFETALGDLYGDPHLAVDATYRPAGGDALPVRVIVSKPDVPVEVIGVPVKAETVMISMPISAVPVVTAGDQIDVGATSYRVQDDATQDAEGVTWMVGVVPV